MLCARESDDCALQSPLKIKVRRWPERQRARGREFVTIVAHVRTTPFTRARRIISLMLRVLRICDFAPRRLQEAAISSKVSVRCSNFRFAAASSEAFAFIKYRSCIMVSSRKFSCRRVFGKFAVCCIESKGVRRALIECAAVTPKQRLLICVHPPHHEGSAGCSLGREPCAGIACAEIPACGFFVCGNGAAKLKQSYVRLLQKKAGR